MPSKTIKKNIKSTGKPKTSIKPMAATNIKIELQLAKEVRELSKEVNKLKDLEFIQVFKNPWKFMAFSLLKGMMVGLGSVLGATVLVALLIYILSQISFVPIIGGFVQEVINQIGIETQATPAEMPAKIDTRAENEFDRGVSEKITP